MLSILLLAASFVPTGADPQSVAAARSAPKLIVSWSGSDSEREDAHFFPLVDAASFEDMWLDAVIRLGSSRWPTGALKPRIDFANCVGFALTAGSTWNSSGYVLDSIVEQGGAWHARVRQDTYAKKGEGDRVRPYGIFLFTRVDGATIVVDEDVRDLIDAPAKWKEIGRLSVPKLAALAPTAPPETAALGPRVLAAIADAATFTRVSDLPHWSPLDCRAPPSPGPFVSASDDAATHGRKLYHLFVRDHAAYCPGPNSVEGSLAPRVPAPIGQTIVKESWEPVRLDPSAAVPVARFGSLPEDHASRDGHVYRRGAPRELFVMLKLDAATPETDAGWIYATVTPDRKTVTAAGRIATCIRCHERAPYDRQFGVPADWAEMRARPRDK
jgi:hypothetical protein